MDNPFHEEAKALRQDLCPFISDQLWLAFLYIATPIACLSEESQAETKRHMFLMPDSRYVD